MTRIYTAKELQRIKRIKDAVIKVKAERKTETRRRIEEIEHNRRLENNSQA